MHFGKRHSGGFKDINVNLEVFFLVVVLLYMQMNFCLLFITNVLSLGGLSICKQFFSGKLEKEMQKLCTNKFSNDCI